jgi:tRNA (guanine-N7-)-methyltransferase
MSPGDVTEPATRAFFGRRKGHPLRLRQGEILATVLPRLQLNLGTPVGEPRSLFAHRPRSVRLEIGFGAGEHLIAQAQAYPEVGFIGCEPFVNGMARMLATAAERQITNIRVHCGDATELLAWMPSASLSGIDLLYPDPWPKRRHWKRRLVQDHRIGEFARVLQRDAAFRFATDWADYAAWTLDVFTRSSDFVWTAERADDWRTAWPGHMQTRYEAKALAAGRRPTYLTFRRL